MTDQKRTTIEKWIGKIFKFFASIQLALFVLSSLAIMSAIGTIYEARYDAQYAQKVIYHSPLMYFILALLCVNLINVMIDRWPWKRHHAGFVFAHVGIVLVIMGSLITRIWGVDGSITFDIGEKNRYVSLPETEMAIYASLGEDSYKMLSTQVVDFFTRPPQENTYEIPLGESVMRVVDYHHYAIRDQKIEATDNVHDGPALRIQIQNQNINMTQWLTRAARKPFETFNLGPAQIVLLAPGVKHEYKGGNEIVISATGSGELKYEIYTQSRGGRTKSGRLPLAEAVDTGWMGMQLRLLKHHPHATQKIEYIPKKRPSGSTTSAALIEFKGQTYWVGLNSNVRFLDDSIMYVVTYRNRMLDIGFDMKLENFKVGRYQGTNRAMTYESLVSVPGLGEQTISMNEPLKHNGYTFYQASFSEDRQGQPTTSILSVNKDPGRPIKYLGSLMIVLGTIMMFYFKHYRIKFFGSSDDSKNVSNAKANT